MYEVVAQTPKEVFLTYVVIIASCALTYPIFRVIFSALGRGLSKWR
jgi:hypothetical protein